MKFTKEEVVKLWQHQFGPWRNFFDEDSSLPFRMHPYTCLNRHDHPTLSGFMADKGILIPTINGWICPFCDYTQDWAHGFQKE